MTIDLREPDIVKDDILTISDKDFNPHNVCIVSGAGSGIGKATCLAAAANNLTVVGLDIDEAGGKKTQELARALGGQMVFVQGDLIKDADVERSVAEAAKLGQIKYLVNIAGIQHIDSIENFPMAKFDFMMRLMIRAPFYLCKLAIPQMKKSRDGCGVIGNMASIHAHVSTLNKPAYNITKFAMRALAQSIAAEGEGKVRAFSVSTSFVKTALALNQIPAQAEQRNITEEEVVRDVMMGNSRVKQMMTPIEVANLFIFGLSRFAKYLDGGDLLFDGGSVLTYAEKKSQRNEKGGKS